MYSTSFFRTGLGLRRDSARRRLSLGQPRGRPADRYRGLRLEPLEARLLLAADVELSLGTLRLADNLAEANDVTMRVVAGGTQVELTDTAGIVPDGNQAFFNGTDTVRYDLAPIVLIALETGAASDAVEIQSSPIGVETSVDTGPENDVMTVGDAGGSLDGIEGLVRLVGGAHEALPQNSAAVTAGATTVAVTMSAGDRLSIADQSSSSGNTYFLTEGTLSRPSGGTNVLLTFHGVETLELTSGDHADTISVGLLGDMNTDGNVDVDDVNGFVLGLNDPGLYAATFGVSPVVHGDIDGNGKLDFDDIQGFTDLLLGIAPVPPKQLTIEGRDDADQIDVKGTLAGSILNLFGGAAMDEMTIVSTGSASVTTGDGQADADVMTLVAGGLGSGIALHGGAAADQVVVESTAIGSVTAADGDAGDDTLLLVASGSSTSVALDGDDGLDTITIMTSGAGSTTEVRAGAGDDLMELWATGANATTRLSGDDGADLTRIKTTAIGSDTRISGGVGNDVVDLGSANDATSVATGIAGTLLVDGSFHDAAPAASVSVTAGGRQIGRDLPVGDTLNINDPGYANPAQYNVDQMSFDRDGTAAVTTFLNIETIRLRTGSGANDINIAGTPASSHTTVESQDALDVVGIMQTGDGSILTVRTAGEGDQIDIASTGTGSVTQIDSGTGDDQLVLLGSGNAAGVELTGDDGADAISIEATGADSQTAVHGGLHNDTITVGNTLSNIGGGIEVDGDDHDPAPTQNVVGPASVTPSGPYIPPGVDPAFPAGSQLVAGSVTAVPLGDRLIVSDDGAVGSQTYTIDNQRVAHVGGASIDYADVEKLQLTTGTSDDFVIITMPATAPALPSVVAVDGNPGADHLAIQGTAGDENITVNPGTDTGPFAVSHIECMQLAGERGNDVIVNATGTRSLILGDAVVDAANPPAPPGPGGDDDILVGGSSTDVVFASYGVDALFGGAGDDYLFADVATTVVPTGLITFDDPSGSGDLIEGGNGTDSAAQLGSSDIIRNINGTLVDGGGIKNVITWLRAQLVPFSNESVDDLVDAAYAALGCGLPVEIQPSPPVSPAAEPAASAETDPPSGTRVAADQRAAVREPTTAPEVSNSRASRRQTRYDDPEIDSGRWHNRGLWARYANQMKLRARND